MEQRNTAPPNQTDEDVISPVQSTATAPPGPTSASPTWPKLSETHPLRLFQQRLPSILNETSYSEIYGLTLSADEPIPFTTTLILQKFLRANTNDVDKAVEQLKATLKWRREFQPLKAAEEEFDEGRFGGLGYVTVIDAKEGEGLAGKQVVTWNIYGAVKDFKTTFEDIDGFIRWRVALMERSIRHLNLANATVPIPDHGQPGHDPYQTVQVHDYLSVRFLRMDPLVRAASRRTIALFQAHYPEMLSRKFFVNVPLVMGWMFAAMKAFMAKETARKLTMLSYGEQLVAELGEGVPTEYGGKGGDLPEVGETVRYTRKVDASSS